MIKIKGYTLVNPPYEGGMALVYKGKKDMFERAFKMVRPDKASNNPRLCEKFLKEIKMQSQLNHPNIVKILDAFPYTDEKGITVTVLEMEWLNGMDLQKYVESKCPDGMEANMAKSIAHSIVDGLEYAHQHSILHLDVKPSNVFRTIDGFIKIIDFGIAKVVGENAEIVEGAEKMTLVTETGESTFKGTLAYASPEQQVGGRLGFYSDIYSFGKTLHYICTGSTDPSVEVSDALLGRVINKCTNQNPRHRYQTFHEVRMDLNAETTPMKCPHCKNVISKGAKFCSSCGKKIEVEKPKVIKCSRCGRKRVNNARFCDNCGTPFQQENNSQTTEKIIGYKCLICGKTTKAYSDGKVNFCNYCGADKEKFTPIKVQKKE